MLRLHVFLGFSAPVLEVSLGSHVLEVHPLVAESTRDEVGLEVNFGDLLGLRVEFFEGEDVEDVRSFLANFEQVLPPGVRGVLVALEGTRVPELVG